LEKHGDSNHKGVTAMGLDMYAFSVAPSEVLPDAAAITRYRFPADGVGLPTGVVHTSHYLIGDVLANGLPLAWRQPVTDTFLSSKYLLPGSTKLHQWHKHPNMHAWMQRLWRAKRRPNSNASFNHHTPIGLERADLDALERVVRQRQLPTCSGSFFGESDGSEQADDLAFIAEARSAMARGRLVYYTSWW
jgi:hypothetical protein